MENENAKQRLLVQEILKGNAKLFEEIILQYQKLVISIVIHFTNNQYYLEEVCQEIFIKVFQSLSQFQFKSKLSTWIGKIAYNHCINFLKKNSKYSNTNLIEEVDDNRFSGDVFDNQIVSVEKVFESNEIFSLINSKINQLPEIYQTILNLFHIQEMSYSEISEILELPEGTVKSYLFRSRKLLKQKLLSSYKEEEFVS